MVNHNCLIFVNLLKIELIVPISVLFFQYRYNTKKFISPIVALLLACVCGATTGLSNAIAKLLTNVGPFTISSVRFAIIFAISFSVVIWRYEYFNH